MNSTPPSASTRAVVISGIEVHLTNSLKHSLLVKLSVDGGDSRSMLLERKQKQIGDRYFTEPMKLQEGSMLSVQIREKHRFQSDKVLAQLNLPLDKLWAVQVPGEPEGNRKKYLVDLPDPSQQIWLNISTVPSSSTGQTSQVDVPEKVPPNQRVANALENATKSLQDFKTAFEWLHGPKVEKGIKVAEALGELNLTAKIVIKLVKVAYDEVKIHDQHHKDLLDLAESMEKIIKFIPAAEEVAKLTMLKDTIESFYELMNQTVDFIEKWLEAGRISKVKNVVGSQTDIDSLKKRYKALETAFDRGIALDSVAGIHYGVKLQELDELKTHLGVITEVQPWADPCMEGTRVNILSSVGSKIGDLEGKNIVWVRGAPGSGKSAVSLSITSHLHEQGWLVTYFRFDRNDATVTTSRALWCLVAYDLAKRYPSVLKHNLSLLRENKVNLTSTTDLFRSIIEGPLSQLTDIRRDHPIVVVIDALDECGGFEGHLSSDRRALLQTLRSWPKLPNQFKLLVTSREEADITRVLSSISAPVPITSGHFLTDNPEAPASIEASQDIHNYLESHFLRIREPLSSLPPEWPGQDIIANMVHRAAGNFMWATTAVNFIETGLNPQDQLESVIGSALKSENMEPLYSLYSTILEISFGKFSSNASDAEVLRGVLGTIVFAYEPLHDADYTRLPTCKPVSKTTVELIRDRLHCVLGQGPTLRFVHKPFDDFLLSKECPPKFRIRIDEAQHLLAKLCVATMTAELRFNICDLKTSYLKNADVPDIETKIEDGISSLLSYSCCFWAGHLVRTPFNAQLLDAVKDMIFDKLLYWFEAMSLLREINQISRTLLLVLNWAKPGSDGEFDDLIRDVHQFIRAFGFPISQSAPHVYISALPFAPEHSAVARQFLCRFPRSLEVSVGKTTDWSRCVFTSKHRDRVQSVAFSPDEKYIVSGSRDCTICICDSETGNVISGPFIGPHRVVSCFFDPDGERVWGYYEDGKVVGWDVETGDKHIEFQAGGDNDDVIGCCCSSNGQSIISVTRQGTVTSWNADTGERLDKVLEPPSTNGYYLVSFSPDCRYIAGARGGPTHIEIWKLEDGSEIQDQCRPPPRVGHADYITALSFSVDRDTFVVSGSHDGTILIWDTKTGDVIDRPLVIGKGWVRAVAYSHEKQVLVEASGGTLKVWNTSTHEAVLSLPDGTDSIAIALSRDGQKALTASDDRTVMWDLGIKDVVPATSAIEGHTGRVWCVAFSPCGKKLASLDLSTIRVWDASTGKPLLNPISILSRHSNLVFSPDGSLLVAFDSYDGYIRAYDVNTGELAFEQDMSDDNHGLTHMTLVAFRSADQRLVTCSDHGVVRICFEDGSLAEDLSASSPQPENPSEPVTILALSPDGLTAIVRDDNRTPRHYLWSTTTRQPLPLTLIDEYIPRSQYRVTYSPSGRFFAGYNDDTLRVWNTQTGELAAAPSTLHGRFMRFTFSPDDRHIAFSYISPSTDGICILDALTGRLALCHRKAHADMVTALAFSPDGKTLVSGSAGGQIGIWAIDDLLGDAQASVGFLGVGTHMHDGWVTDPDGQLLFWVPGDQRSALVWPENAGMVIGGRGMRTELDLTRFRYGLNWEECFADRK